MLLKDKVVIITGVGPGMGRSLSLLAVDEGAKVAVSARSEGFIREVVDEIAAKGGQAIAVQGRPGMRLAHALQEEAVLRAGRGRGRGGGGEINCGGAGTKNTWPCEPSFSLTRTDPAAGHRPRRQRRIGGRQGQGV